MSLLKIKDGFNGYSIKFIGQKKEQFCYVVKIADQDFEFFTGIGWVERTKIGVEKRKSPTIEDVLECLGSDAECGLYSFEDFCDNLGYSNDSIKAFQTYRQCEEIAKKIRKLERSGVLERKEED